MNPTVEILMGDCREVMRTLPAKSVQCVVTSPPYWGLRDYTAQGQIGLEESMADFLKVMVEVFQEVHRVLRDDGVCFMNLGDTYLNKRLLGVPWRAVFALIDNPPFWILRSDIIWHKPNSVPEPARGRPGMAHEYVFQLVKSKKYFFDDDAIREVVGDEPNWDDYEAGLGSNNGADSLRWSAGYKKISHKLVHPSGRGKRSVWTIPTKGFKGAHFATYPPDLVKPCILAGTSERGCCVQCGRPWRRVTHHTEAYKERLGTSWNDHNDDLNKGQRGIPSAFRGGAARVTTGWEPECKCGVDETRPCLVLDPFGGSGTTGEVALSLGRSVQLIELNPEYQKFMEERTAQQRLGLYG